MVDPRARAAQDPARVIPGRRQPAVAPAANVRAPTGTFAGLIESALHAHSLSTNMMTYGSNCQCQARKIAADLYGLRLGVGEVLGLVRCAT